jgi:hypothetical protein
VHYEIEGKLERKSQKEDAVFVLRVIHATRARSVSEINSSLFFLFLFLQAIFLNKYFYKFIFLFLDFLKQQKYWIK